MFWVELMVTNPVGDLSSRDEIVENLKYNKAAGSDSIVAELLKSDGPSLVNALNEMIQQVWLGETLPESWTEGVLCPVYKKSDKLDCKELSRHLPTECSV
jgi:hypothetical protein